MSGFMDLFNNFAGTRFNTDSNLGGIYDNVMGLAKLKQAVPGDNSTDYMNMAQSNQMAQPAPEQPVSYLQNNPQQQAINPAAHLGLTLMDMIMQSQKGKN